MMTYTNSDPTQPADPVIGILGSVPSSPQAGYPQITIPMGYVATTRRTQNVSVNGNAYDERNLIGIGVRDRAGDAPAPAGQHGQPEHVPLRQDDPGAAVRLARRLQPELRHDPEAARRHDRRSCRSRSRPSRRRACRTRLDRRHAHLRDAGQGVPRRASRSRTPRARRSRPCATSTRTRSTRRSSSTRTARRRRAARCYGIPVLLDDSIDVEGHGHDRRLDRAPGLDAERRLDDRREAEGGRGDHPRQDERHRARRPVRREHARGLLVARRPGDAARPTPTRRRPARRAARPRRPPPASPR